MEARPGGKAVEATSGIVDSVPEAARAGGPYRIGRPHEFYSKFLTIEPSIDWRDQNQKIDHNYHISNQIHARSAHRDINSGNRAEHRYLARKIQAILDAHHFVELCVSFWPPNLTALQVLSNPSGMFT